MAKQTFTTGQVLTAAQVTALQTNGYNQTVTTVTANYVLLAADVGTRVYMNAAGATTITVNTGVFAAGDTVWLGNIGAGSCVVTAGTATVSKFSTASLTLSQYQGAYLYFVSTGVAILYSDSAGASTPLTTKGDLFGYDTANARVPIGTNNQVLTADSTASLGLKWATASSGGMTSLGSGSLPTGAISLSIAVASGYNDIAIYITGFRTGTANDKCNLRFNADTGTSYIQSTTGSTGGSGQAFNSTSIPLNEGQNSSGTNAQFYVYVPQYTNTAVWKQAILSGTSNNNTTNTSNNYFNARAGYWNGTAAITSVDLYTNAGVNFTGGTYVVYGVK